jgi:hypothetical protein
MNYYKIFLRDSFNKKGLLMESQEILRQVKAGIIKNVQLKDNTSAQIVDNYYENEFTVRFFNEYITELNTKKDLKPFRSRTMTRKQLETFLDENLFRY